MNDDVSGFPQSLQENDNHKNGHNRFLPHSSKVVPYEHPPIRQHVTCKKKVKVYINMLLKRDRLSEAKPIFCFIVRVGILSGVVVKMRHHTV